MAYPAPVLTALGRLKSFFNGGIWVPAQGSPGYNPGGFDGDGHAVNFVPALRDVATVGEGIAAIATEIETAADTLPEMREIREEVEDNRALAQAAATAAHADAQSVNGPAIAAGILRARRAAFFYSRVR